MNDTHLHIIALNVPYPPNYGGIIDIFYRIKALSQIGIKIHLHCFKYGRKEDETLLEYCENVFYYGREKGIKHFIKSKPYIVSTRNSKSLLTKLLKDDYPILFEGLHTTFYIKHEKLKSRGKLLRSHNIEHLYYFNLAKSESNFLRKIYLYTEAQKLKKYYKIHSQADRLLAISKEDEIYLKKDFSNVHYIPAFHENEKIDIKEGKGDYILFHGNLSVTENVFAIKYLIENVFNNIDYRVIIAGKDPGAKLSMILKQFENIELFANPNDVEMSDLIKNAHINLLYTFQSTGLKLKLLNSLFKGRFCIVNSMMVNNTGLESECIIKDHPDEIIDEINKTFNIEFNKEMIDHRNKTLSTEFSNQKNALKINEILNDKKFSIFHLK